MASEANKHEVVEFLNSAFAQAQLAVPDWGSWFGPDADYTCDDPSQPDRMLTEAEMKEQLKEFRIHALRQALLVGEPHYQYLIALALIEGQWGLSPADLLRNAARSGVTGAQETLDVLLGRPRGEAGAGGGQSPSGTEPLAT